MTENQALSYKFYKKSHNDKYLKKLMQRNIRKPRQECVKGGKTTCQKKKTAAHPATSRGPLEQLAFNNIAIPQNIEESNPIPDSSLQTSQIVSSENSESSIELFTNHLKHWAIGHHIAQTAITDLLKIIKAYLHLDSLPSDARTILKTKSINDKIINVHPGKYYHFGVKRKVLLNLIQNNFNGDMINISLNIDGLPLTKSSGSQFWPILIKIDELEKLEPFPVGIYHGENKPGNSNSFLKTFVEEIKILQKEGLNFNGKIVKIMISKILCDAPAKAFILCIKNFNAYFSCTKCKVEGEFLSNRMTFPDIHSKLRTNEEFYAQTDEDYHKGTSVLCDLKIDLVTKIPLDYMHLILLGVMKRLLGFWVKGNRAVRLSKQDIDTINEKIKLIYESTPYEFSRKPREITEYERWKSVEFRTFLLYYGPWLMKPFLQKQYFLHFLSLHCAVRILICDDLINKYLDYAQELLIFFVQEFGNSYGEEYVSHNIHNLIHLTLDVKKFGSLDKFSCFPFVNYMHKIKMMLKTSKNPLSQFIKRVNEFDAYAIHNVEQKPYFKENGFDIINNKSVECFSVIHYKGFRIGIKEPNCNFLLQNNKAIKVTNIFRMDNEFYIKYKTFELKPYFDTPMDSTVFWCGVAQITEQENIGFADNILRKAFKIKNCFLSILHKN